MGMAMGEKRSLVESFYEAFNRNDLEGARQYFTHDMESIDPSGTRHGYDAFRAFAEVFKVAPGCEACGKDMD
jgi:SnoaL-like protein